MNTSRIWRKNKTSVTFGALTAISLLFSAGDISRSMESIASLKSAIASNSEKQSQLEQQFKFEQEQAAIAEARYKKGCLPVVAEVYPHKYIAISEGQIIKDRVTGKPLPSGTVVCDANGTTGVISEGDVGAIAFTGDRDMVASRLRRFRGGTYSQPINKEK
ncbi:MAG: hypothetical protein AB1589_30885 [Cyanobacteriota bacterium]